MVNIQVDKYLDVTGQVCPIPAAETRKVLREMETGKTLEIIGDFCPALENVIAMAQKNGAEVLFKESGENFFKAIVKKL